MRYGLCPGRNNTGKSMTATAAREKRKKVHWWGCSWSTWILKSQSRKMVEDLEQTKVSSSGFALIFIVSFRWKISLPGYSNDLHLGMDNRSVISWNQVCCILFRQNLKNIFLRVLTGLRADGFNLFCESGAATSLFHLHFEVACVEIGSYVCNCSHLCETMGQSYTPQIIETPGRAGGKSACWK